MDGKPLPGVALGLVQKDRNVERFLGESTIATDAKGQFQFQNVGPDELYLVYGLMDNCRQQGSIPIRQVRVGASGTVKDVGKLTIQRGYRLSGKLILADGNPVPDSTRVLLSREEAWDSQTAVVGPDGSFSFAGLPSEGFSLSANVRGYHASPKNRSYDALNGLGLVGTVKGDIEGLRFLLEPGPALRPDFRKLKQSDWQEFERRRKGPLAGAPELPIKEKRKSEDTGTASRTVVPQVVGAPGWASVHPPDDLSSYHGFHRNRFGRGLDD
jgi:hypothetical protein